MVADDPSVVLHAAQERIGLREAGTIAETLRGQVETPPDPDDDISECDSTPPAVPAVVTTDQEATFWFICDRDGVQHTAQWSPSVPEQRPQWEANGRRVETTEGPVVLRGTLELSDKLLGFDVEDPEGVQLLIDLPSGRMRPLTWEGWTTSARFFPELAP